jgi:hypothetical protein
MLLDWLISTRMVKFMTENVCKYYANLVEQMFIKNLNQSTKDIEFHIFRDHLLTLRRK